MIERKTRLRFRRLFRKRRRQVEDIGLQAEDQIDRLFFRRLNRLVDVRRFVLTWIVLLGLLIGGLVAQTVHLTKYYQRLSPVPGGTYTEGIIGSYTNANPLYATDAVDSAVSRLIFSGLFKYDSDNKLVPDLADKITLNEQQDKYTVHVRSDVKWHDGQPVTADDVVFTYKTIQNADAKSPLFSSWQKVKIEAVGGQTVAFTLPGPLSSFPSSLTVGLIPEHILKSVSPSQLRSARFNTIEPIGTGPFKFERVEVTGVTTETRSEQIALAQNPDYSGGMPALQRYVIRSFHDESQLIEALKKQELNAAAGLTNVPDELKEKHQIHTYNVPLTGEVLVFFKNSNEVLADLKVRQALVKGTDQSDILTGIGFPVLPAREPFLPTHIGYNKDLTQFGKNVDEAKKLLEDGGWKVGQDGIRAKDKQVLSFRLYAQNRPEYAYITQKLQSQWHDLGIKVDVLLQEDSDLQTTVTNHAYDALLYGISLGTDPDVYAYWHSSQADVRALNRLNFSEYKSALADKSLEAGRSRSDPALRAIKYKPFLEAWRADAPAMALYQPRFLYVTNGQLFGYDTKEMNIATDRYANVQNWMVRQSKVNK